ncbi:MAG: regulatory protein RecX, partial [Candidatus Subteraquimicrobiales bacterium]|nr:regulatory protein RecX [Candidatus Subteraquimicrobiales bacterium]
TDKILLKLAGENYLNDEEFTRLFIKERTELKSLGKRRIKAELVFKGIDREIIETAFDGYNTEDEFEKALVLAQKKLNSLNGLAKTTQKRRLSQFLLRRGFDFEMVLGLCRKLIND